jgi:hypothetical protein
VAPNPATPAKLIVTFPRGRSSFLSDPWHHMSSCNATYR